MADTFTTYFSDPQWKWEENGDPETHFTLSNQVEVCLLAEFPDNPQDYLPVKYRYVDVPMEFYQFARQVLGITDLSSYYLFLDQIGPSAFLFGLCGINRQPFDLWVWTRATVPDFLINM